MGVFDDDFHDSSDRSGVHRWGDSDDVGRDVSGPQPSFLSRLDWIDVFVLAVLALLVGFAIYEIFH